MTKMCVYINGRLDKCQARTANTYDNSVEAEIGAHNNGSTYRINGSIDEVRIFNIARSSSQILGDYQSDTLAAHNRGQAYNVLYSTTAGVLWNRVSTNSVTMTGANGTAGAQTLTVSDLALVTSTGPLAATNQVALVTSDYAGNVSTTVYTILVDAFQSPTLESPVSGAFLSTSNPAMTWIPATSGGHRLQLSLDEAFTQVIADSVTANAYYVSTNTLSQATPYWWRVGSPLNANWSSTASFTVDLVRPAYSAPEVSTDAVTGPWTSLPMVTYLSSTVATVRLTVQDAGAGLLTSTGLPAGLVGQWHFDESSGTVALDASTSANTGSLANLPNRITGRSGWAPGLNGTNQNITVADNPSLKLGANDLTLEVWFKTTTDGVLLEKAWNSSPYQMYGLRVIGGKVWGAATDCGTGACGWTTTRKAVTGSRSVNDGAWHHMALVRSGANLKLYVDGLLDGSNTDASPWNTDSSAILSIGRESYSSIYFAGAIDDVRVYNIARTPSQVLADYQSDTLAAHNRGKSYNVLYSSNAGLDWSFVSTNSVTLTGANGATGAQTLTVSNLQLATSTGPLAATNQVALVTSDYAGNVSTAVYTILVEAFTPPAPAYPGNGAGVNLLRPTIAWTPVISSLHRLQLSLDEDFTQVVTDSITANASYVSTNTLNHGSSYWWRVGSPLASHWSSTSSFIVDIVQPVYSVPEVSTDAATGPWTSLPMATYLSSTTATLRLTVQDPDAGLLTSTGLPTGLVGQWHFDESSGTVALDASTNANTGSLVNGPAWVAGKRGSALNFNGSDSYVSVPDTALLDPPAGITISAWVKTSATNDYSGIVHKYGFGNAGGYSISMHLSGKVRADFSNGTTYITTNWQGNIKDGAWHHVAATYDGSFARIYVDGVAGGSAFGTGFFSSTNKALLIGNDDTASSRFFNGSIDEVRIYSVARSSIQILADYQSDTLAAHNRGQAYNVLYSTTAGVLWNRVSTNSVTMTGVNGATGTQTLTVSDLALVTSTGPLAATNQVALVTSDYAGNVSTAVYTILVDAFIPPTLLSPAGGSYVGTLTPGMLWTAPVEGVYRLQLSLDAGFTQVIADSITLNAFYVSTSTLTDAAVYWWRVGSSMGTNWSEAGSFTVDLAAPVFSAPEFSTDAVTGPWTALPSALYASSNVVSARLTVQDPGAGLLVSTGPPAGLVGQWHFDEGSGIVSLDMSTKAYNGALSGGAVWSAGRKGPAGISFNGSGLVTIGNLGAFPQTGVIEFWVNSAAMEDWRNLLTTKYNGSNAGIRFEENSSGTFGVVVGNDAGTYDGLNLLSSGMQINRWYHIAYVWDRAANWEWGYVDGVLASNNAHTLWPTTIPDFRLGTGFSTDAARQWNGLIDEVRVFNMFRSSSQILADYQSDTIAAHHHGKAYSVLYSTNSGATWSYVSTNSVTLTGDNGTQTAQTLTAAGIPLFSTEGGSAVNLVRFSAADMTGNVSTTAYSVLVGTAASNVARTWTNAAGNLDWNTAGNWNPAGVPGAGDYLTIDRTETVTAGEAAAAVSFAGLRLGGVNSPTLKLSTGIVSGGWLEVLNKATFQQDTALTLSLTSATVFPGGLLSHTANAASKLYAVNLNVSGDFDLQAGSTISVNGRGYAGGASGGPGYGPGGGIYGAGGGGGGGGHGALGGQCSNVNTGGAVYDILENPADLGSGGAGSMGSAGGAGGGAVLLSIGGTLTLNGQITANANTGVNGGSYGSGGGAGGTVNITAGTLAGTGVVQANGGAGYSNAISGGGGAGGRIAIVAASANTSNLALNAYNGPGYVNGGAGTIYTKDPAQTSSFNLILNGGPVVAGVATSIPGAVLIIDTLNVVNAQVSFAAGSYVTVTSSFSLSGASLLTLTTATFIPAVTINGNNSTLVVASATFQSQVTIASGGTLTQTSAAPLTLNGGLTMKPGSLLQHTVNTNTRQSAVNLIISGDFDLQAGSTISVNGRGYAGGASGGPGYGPGGGIYGAGGGGGGGGHGALGGQCSNVNTGGAVYDILENPADLGSGGAGSMGSAGGAGGGAVLLSIGGTLTLNGQITANANTGVNGGSYGSGGGAGGTVNITVGTLAGAGLVQANGGAGYSNAISGGGGAGGRIALAILTSASGFTGSYTASGASGYAAGGTGTTYTGGALFPPTAVPSSLLTINTSSAIAQWSANGNLAGTYYGLEASTATGAGFTAQQTSVTLNTSALLQDLFSNTTYYFRVDAMGGGSTSTYTNLGSSSTLALAPSNVVLAPVQTDEIGVSWTAYEPLPSSSSARGFLFEASTATFGTAGAVIKSSGTPSGMASQLALPNLLSNTTYFLRLASLNHGGARNTLVLASTRTAPGGPPGSVAVNQVVETSAALSWQTVYSDGYELLASSTAFDGTGAVLSSASLNGSLDRLTVQGLIANTTYTLRAGAIFGQTTSYALDITELTLALPPALSTSTALSSTTIQISWDSNGNPGGTTYEVVYSSKSGFSFPTSTSTLTSALSYDVSGLLADTSYWFKVRAMNAAGLRTAFDSTVSTRTYSLPLSVSGLAASVNGASSMTWTWSAGGFATSYRLYTASSTSLVAEVSGLSYEDTGLSTNAARGLRVAGVNFLGQGPLSSSATSYTFAAQVTGSSVTSRSSDTVTLAWEANGNPAGTAYQVAYSTVDAFITGGFISTSTALTNNPRTLTGLLPLTTYYFHVRALSSASVYTDFDEAISTHTRATTPVITVTGVSNNGYYKPSPVPVYSFNDPELVYSTAHLNGLPFDSGTPVVAHNSGGPREFVTEECGRLVATLAVEDWARALTEGRLLGIKYRDKQFLAFLQKKTLEMTRLGLGLSRERVPFAVAGADSRRQAHSHAHRP